MGSNPFDTNEIQPKVEKGYAGDVTPEEAWEILKSDESSVLVDVRTAPEWVFTGFADLSSLGKQPAFISWREYPRMEVNGSFVEQLMQERKLAKDTPILFLCKVGGRSLDAAIEMAKYGFTKCYNISNGFEGDLDGNGQRGRKNGWKSCNLPWEQR